jgi:hypothetical protein
VCYQEEYKGESLEVADQVPWFIRDLVGEYAASRRVSVEDAWREIRANRSGWLNRPRFHGPFNELMELHTALARIAELTLELLLDLVIGGETKITLTEEEAIGLILSNDLPGRKYEDSEEIDGLEGFSVCWNGVVYRIDPLYSGHGNGWWLYANIETSPCTAFIEIGSRGITESSIERAARSLREYPVADRRGAWKWTKKIDSMGQFSLFAGDNDEIEISVDDDGDSEGRYFELHGALGDGRLYRTVEGAMRSGESYLPRRRTGT